MNTIRKGDTGAAVEDVQRRLRVLGYELEVDGVFANRTQQAVCKFREAQGLPEGDCVDSRTWTALVDASFLLGDRVLYLRMPYFHGDDVRSLQNILDVLGFVSGDPDGIFGPHTEHALRGFQSSLGLVDDGIAGATTYETIERLRHAWEGKSRISADTISMGFARAAEVLEQIEACFYGLDATGRQVAARVANLARATASDTCVTSADERVGVPCEGALMIGVSSDAGTVQEGVPTLELASDFAFATRLRTALDFASRHHNRIVIVVPPYQALHEGARVEGERWEQHLAVVLLDAYCMALS